MADTHFRAAHRTKLRSTDPTERLSGEIKRRTDVVGIFPKAAAAIMKIAGSLRSMATLSPRTIVAKSG